MTIEEKNEINNTEFAELWTKLWGENKCFQYRNEQKTSAEKLQHLKEGVATNYDSFNLLDCIEHSTTAWQENEWGFPKGRKNYQENDLTCAVREFEEETGISRTDVDIVSNVFPFQEIFTGSNMKSYKHKYYLGYISDSTLSLAEYQKSEVSKVEWKTFDEAVKCVRSYHYERKQILHDIDTLLRTRIMVDL
jgi:8-oxo-dGTP pyrophosphatase MutT (NUDIX family)